MSLVVDEQTKFAPVKPQTGVIDFDKYEEIPVKTSGRDCPPPIASWRDVDLGKLLNENIEHAGYTKPTPVQKYALPTVIEGRDLMGCAQTGSGKTAAFLLPIIASMLREHQYNIRDRDRNRVNPVALILAPTRELACQILDESKKFCAGSNIRTSILYGGVPMGEQLRDLFRGCDVLVATPGRLTDVIGRGKVSLQYIKYLVLDEADRMLDMGFEPQIRKIVEEFDMPKKENRQTLMFSATFPKEIRALAASFLKDYVFLTVGRVGSTTELVEQRFIYVGSEAEREMQLLDLLRKTEGLSLIFVETKKKANYLDHFLRRQGFGATSIHGDRNQVERTAALRAFSSGMTPILIATNVAARGLDISGISHVINFEMAANIDDYVHRIGRTGRAGKRGVSTTFVTDENSNIVPDLIKLLQDAQLEVPPWMRALDKRGGRGAGTRPPYGRGGYGGQRGGYRPPTTTHYPPVPGYNPYGGQSSYQYPPAPSYPPPPPQQSGYSYPPANYPAPPPPQQAPPSSLPSNGHGHPPSHQDRDRESDRKRRKEDDDFAYSREKYLKSDSSQRVSSSSSYGDRDRYHGSSSRYQSSRSRSRSPRRDSHDRHHSRDRDRSDQYQDRSDRHHSRDRSDQDRDRSDRHHDRSDRHRGHDSYSSHDRYRR